MLNACILIKTTPTMIRVLLGEVSRMKGVNRCYIVYGRFDIVTFVEAPDYPSIRAIADKINSLEGVRSTETLVEA